MLIALATFWMLVQTGFPSSAQVPDEDEIRYIVYPEALNLCVMGTMTMTGEPCPYYPTRFDRILWANPIDSDFNAYGDTWYAPFEGRGIYSLDLPDVGFDSDNDDAINIQEFRWGTIPIGPIPVVNLFLNARDFDQDQWNDGPEIQYWNDPTNDQLGDLVSGLRAGNSPTDPDKDIDSDGDGIPNIVDSDSDNDGVEDGDEIKRLTFPEYRDSDCDVVEPSCDPPASSGHQARQGKPRPGDGMDDKLEYEFWTNFSGSSPGGDCDWDGIINVLDGDSDNDGSLDSVEVQRGTSPCDPDHDDDGLYDGDETITDPMDPDTDNDTMGDEWEYWSNTNPQADDRYVDMDGDGLNNLYEYHFGSHPREADADRDLLRDNDERSYGSNPNEWDSDDDGMPDGWEHLYGLPPTIYSAHWDSDDDVYDEDNDGFPEHRFEDVDEYSFGRPLSWTEAQGPWLGGTNPRDPDTDKDGRQDGAEDAEGTNPLGVGEGAVVDRDGDGLANLDEMNRGTRPGDPDTDRDGLCDGGGPTAVQCGLGESIDYGTSPFDPDSDSDGLTDGAEVQLYAASRIPDTDGDGKPNILDSDSDNDGLRDDADLAIAFEAILVPDYDGDGLTDYEEVRQFYPMGVKPENPDSDTDNILDGVEILELGTDPMVEDTDGDGLKDGEELARGTNPLSPDSDADGMDDKWEYDVGLNPLENDADADADRDGGVFGLSNLNEYLINNAYPGATSPMNPRDPDSDGDTLNDWFEVLLGTNPQADDRNADTDNDKLPNAIEYILGTNAAMYDTDGDRVGDGAEVGDLNDLSYTILQTDPLNGDTDGDGLDDGYEVLAWETAGGDWRKDYDADAASGLSPSLRHNLRDQDSDGDGLDDGQEMLGLRTKPHDPDSDGDGDDDYVEVMQLGTDPTDEESNRNTVEVVPTATDSDGDGLSDSAESEYGTSSSLNDTDSDFMDDGAERIAWGANWNTNGNRLVQTSSDGDGIPDGVEFALQGMDRKKFYVTSPYLDDSDGDGMKDDEEAQSVEGVPTAQARQLKSQGRTPSSGAWGPNAALPGFLAPLAALLSPLGLLPEAPQVPVLDPPYILGAFGTVVVRTSADNGGLPDPQKDDTDGDGLLDLYEKDHGLDPLSSDPDDDTLTDLVEKVQGTDPFNQDTDGDGIPDNLESRVVVEPTGEYELPVPLIKAGVTDGLGFLLGELLPIDDDTDNDGLPDNEGQLKEGLSGVNPDTDGDGLSDGREFRPDLLPRTDDTSQDALLTCTEATPSGKIFHPLIGFPTYQGLPETNTGRALTKDSDGDGILDGLEDANLNGVLDPNEGNPGLQDTDGDGVADPLELNRWSNADICGLAKPFSYNGGALRYDFSYRASSWQTNPTDSDTDNDGLGDRTDLDPTNIAQEMIKIDLGAYQQLQAIDPTCPWCQSEYQTDLILNLNVWLDGAHIASLKLDLPDNLPLHKPTDKVDLAQYIRTAGGTLTNTLVFGLLRPASLVDGVIELPLLEDATRYPHADEAPKGVVRLVVAAQDDDLYEERSDVIDLGVLPDINPAEFMARVVCYDGGSMRSDRIVHSSGGDGDGSAGKHGTEDDGRLGLRMGSGLLRHFFDRAWLAPQSVPAGSRTDDLLPQNNLTC